METERAKQTHPRGSVVAPTNLMKYLLVLLCLLAIGCNEEPSSQKQRVKPAIESRWTIELYRGHQYVIRNSSTNWGSGIAHDPDCPYDKK